MRCGQAKLLTMVGAVSALSILISGFFRERIAAQSSAQGVPPLTEAVWRENTSALPALLAAGNDPEARDPMDDLGRTPWMWAITARNDAALRLLLAKVPSVRPDDSVAHHRLHITATLNNVAAARQLLARGVPVDAAGAADSGSTALMVAAASGYTEFMTLLLGAGADPNREDQHHDTALMGAVRIGSQEAVRLLIARRADVNRADGEGRTALMWAARSARADIVKMLIEAGAHLDATDHAGQTALTVSTEQHNDDVAQFLRSRGAKGARHVRPFRSPRAAVEKSLPLLQSGAATWAQRQQCSACHHQPLILQVTALAKKRGFAIDETQAEQQLRRVAPVDNPQRRALAAGTDQDVLRFSLRTGGDPSFANAWFQAALIQIGVPRDATREANAVLQARMQLPDGRWRFGPPRVPIESSDFTATALAIRVLQAYGPPDRASDFTARIARARAWLVRNRPVTTDDKVFRLLGLRWSDAAAPLIRSAANALIREQNRDGGWSQLAGANSDAYATGLVMVALYQAGALAATDRSYLRGVDFLLRTQEDDGSWLVHKRANPINAYFESGFPHGKFQFISFAGTCWATMALMNTG